MWTHWRLSCDCAMSQSLLLSSGRPSREDLPDVHAEFNTELKLDDIQVDAEQRCVAPSISDRFPMYMPPGRGRLHVIRRSLAYSAWRFYFCCLPCQPLCKISEYVPTIDTGRSGLDTFQVVMYLTRAVCSCAYRKPSDRHLHVRACAVLEILELILHSLAVGVLQIQTGDMHSNNYKD